MEKFVESSFERITYTDAITTWRSRGKKFEFPVKWGIDLQSEHERCLTEEHIGRPVVVMNYPKEIKAFYMRLNDDEKTVAAMDVLAPGIGEIIGGSQREERLDVLDRRMDEMHLDKQALWLVPRPAPLRHGPARRLRPGLRADDHVRDGHGERPRRDPVSAHAEECGFLTEGQRMLQNPRDSLCLCQFSGRRQSHTATAAIISGAPRRSQPGTSSSCRRTALPNIVRTAQIFAVRGTIPRSRQLRMCGP